jgi:hypothetical protein
LSDYTKLTSFDTKDALSTGDPLKRVKGTELDDEFDAIATAVATKANSASPAFTGTPTGPTATALTSTTQLATTAFVQTALQVLYPVGTIYTNIAVSTNPATLFGFGTWVAITGRVVVGLDSGDASFDTVGETGGSKDAIVVSHTHTATDSGHTHGVPTYSGWVNGGNIDGRADGGYYRDVATTTGTANISVSTTGSSGTNANLPPYVVAYVWKRVS